MGIRHLFHANLSHFCDYPSAATQNAIDKISKEFGGRIVIRGLGSSKMFPGWGRNRERGR